MRCPTCGTEMFYDYENMYYVCPNCGTIVEDEIARDVRLNKMAGERSVFIQGRNFTFTKRRRVVNYNSVVALTEIAISVLETSSCVEIDERALRLHALHLAEQAILPLIRSKRPIGRKLKYELGSYIAYLLARQFLIPLCEKPKFKRSAKFKRVIENIKPPKARPNLSLLISYISNKAKDPMKAKRGLTKIWKVIADFAPAIPITEPDLTSFFSVLASSATFGQFLEGFECKKYNFSKAVEFTMRAIESLEDPSLILGTLGREHTCTLKTTAFLPEEMARLVRERPEVTVTAFEYGIWLRPRKGLPKVRSDWVPVKVAFSIPPAVLYFRSRGKSDRISSLLYLGLKELLNSQPVFSS